MPRIRLAVLALVAVAACGPITPPDRFVADGAGVEGFLRDADGRPLEVLIEIDDATGRSILSKERSHGSEADGFYRIEAPPGAWTITFFKPAYTDLKLPITVVRGRYLRRDVVLSPSR